MFDKEGYYSLREILGYNCKYSIVLSDRGRGKSFAAKHFLMAQPGTSMCLYRQSSDMHMAIASWIEPLVSQRKNTEIFPIYEAEDFTWEGNDLDGFTLLYQGVKKIWFRYLTQVNHIKQEVFPDDMNWVWLDEFIPMAYKKLPGVESEGDAIRTVVKTIEHDTNISRADRGLKEVRVILFANPFTWNNPILAYLKLRPIEGGGIKRIGPGVVLEQLPPMEQKSQRKKKTADDFLGNEVNVTQGWQNEMAYVEVLWPRILEPQLSIRINRQYFLICRANNSPYWYISLSPKHTNTSGTLTYDRWGNLKGQEVGETCLDGTQFLKLIKERVRRGQMRYKDLNTKFSFINGLEEVR